MNLGNNKWRTVTKAKSCPACEHSGWCAWTPDEKTLRCMRDGQTPAGMRCIGPDKDGGVLFTSNKVDHRQARSTQRQQPAKTLDWAAMADRCTAAISDEQLKALAAALGVTIEVLKSLNAGWSDRATLREMKASGAGWPDQYPDGVYTFSEHAGAGHVVGLSLRTADGRKGFPSGKVSAKRGLIVPTTLGAMLGPVLGVEGASDVAACLMLGIAAVGRPSCSSGADDLARLLEGRDMIVVGEHDMKSDGKWPGRDGAQRIAQRLASMWQKKVVWALPPQDAKDVREWLKQRVAAGLDLSEAKACHAAGREFVKVLLDNATEDVSQASLLVRLALEHYRIGRSENDKPFAVQHDGPNIALMFKGSRSALRSTLAREYRQQYDRIANAAALNDAMTVLDGMAQDAEPEPVALRIAKHDGGIVIDLGDAEGRAIVVGNGGWEVVDQSPVLFCRTGLTAALPIPQTGGSLDVLRDLLNVTAETWPLVRAWLVAALLPDIPHPILMFDGIQGSGKSTNARRIVGLFDPSPVPLRSPPRDGRQWAITAAGSWGVVVDNVSVIPPWWSDALCKAVTGDGWIDRTLYTDSEITILTFRRAIILTSIDTGALRGDLADRLLLADLEPIDESDRQTEAELDKTYAQARPQLFGALLDLLANLLQILPNINPPKLPRMADFGRVLAALDKLDGQDAGAFNRYMSQRDRIVGDVIEGDPVATAIIGMIDENGPWSGTSGELLDKIKPEKPSRAWPPNGQAVTGRLKRLKPPLASVGISITIPKERTRYGRIITIERMDKGSSPSSPLSPGPAGGPLKQGSGDDPPLDDGEDRHRDRHTETITGGPETTPGVEGGKGDDPVLPVSDAEPDPDDWAVYPQQGGTP